MTSLTKLKILDSTAEFHSEVVIYNYNPLKIIIMKINIPEDDKNMHLYLGYLGFNGPYAVCRQIAEWIKEKKCENETARFIEANKDNFEVMKYLNELL